MTKGAREVLRSIIREAKQQAAIATADDEPITVRLKMSEASTRKKRTQRHTKTRSMTYTILLPRRKPR